ncbi:transposase [Corynebacterium hylobatis]|uniref:Transposase n=1 Tax=Corynebacterium hylobatis TaxID=1859290 RepID=A0A430HUZ8_9CORY|nr:Mu transposase C-terminal domain-containing protein [Corynebacterium hylobatis]RSZ61174.1 transposase [Corynebacterium hylobatis]
MSAGGRSQTPTGVSAREHTAAARWEILRRHVEDGIPLTRLATQAGIGLRTLQRWHAAYRTEGIAGLSPVQPAPRGRRIHPELHALIEGLALIRPRLTGAAITRRAKAIAAEQGWNTVSSSTVRSIIAGLDPGLLTLAHQGPVAYRDTFELVWRHRTERANATWQTDHTALDLLIRDANGAPARPWLTVILDDYSRAVCGYLVFLGAPSAMNTALALRQGIWPKRDPEWPMCGIPDVLYVDHGPDFTSHHLAQTARDLHFEIIYSAVARPQGRGKIERIFRTLNTELLAELPGYLAPGHRRPEPVLTLPELDAAIGAFISSTYHQRIHPEINTTPQQAWLGTGWLPRLPDSIDDLNLLLLTVATPRVVHRDGVHFQGLRYLSPLLAAYVKEPVVIRYDPRDISEIKVFHHDQYICTAVDPDHAAATVSLKDIQAARRTRRRQLREQINERIAVVADHHPRPRPTSPEPSPSGTPARKKPKLRTYLEED